MVPELGSPAMFFLLSAPTISPLTKFLSSEDYILMDFLTSWVLLLLKMTLIGA
jgi:hypothetical protein